MWGVPGNVNIKAKSLISNGNRTQDDQIFTLVNQHILLKISFYSFDKYRLPTVLAFEYSEQNSGVFILAGGVEMDSAILRWVLLSLFYRHDIEE